MGPHEASDEHEEQGFAATMKAASWEDHHRAENAPFMRALLSGESSAIGFANLLAQNFHAYRVLEGAAEVMANDPIAGPFVEPALHRLAKIDADLIALVGEDWADHLPALSATEAYAARLEEVCWTWPGGFVAHHYVRYLGDLSGGQLIRRIVQRHYGLESGGTSSLVFDGIDNLVQFKHHYRHLLDIAPWDAAERTAIVDEVVVAFRLNADVLNALPNDPRLARTA